MNSQRILMSNLFRVVLIALLLSGCLGRSAPKVTYFSLLSMADMGERQTVAALSAVHLGIGPVTIPDSLKRPQIVTRSRGNQHAFDEFNRWAGVLEQDIAAVLADNLDPLLGIDTVAVFPWGRYFQPTFRVVVDIQQLDGDLTGEAVLRARWTVADAEGKKLLASDRSVHAQPLEEATFAALVRAESRLLAALSRDIAVAIAAMAE
ncbi:MAG: PqiC family protein [Desulfuromonadales bacterium]|nr:PqiC family protein [Desulfuromonadales bacterium]